MAQQSVKQTFDNQETCSWAFSEAFRSELQTTCKARSEWPLISAHEDLMWAAIESPPVNFPTTFEKILASHWNSSLKHIHSDDPFDNHTLISAPYLFDLRMEFDELGEDHDLAMQSESGSSRTYYKLIRQFSVRQFFVNLNIYWRPCESFVEDMCALYVLLMGFRMSCFGERDLRKKAYSFLNISAPFLCGYLAVLCRSFQLEHDSTMSEDERFEHPINSGYIDMYLEQFNQVRTNWFLVDRSDTGVAGRR